METHTELAEFREDREGPLRVETNECRGSVQREVGEGRKGMLMAKVGWQRSSDTEHNAQARGNDPACAQKRERKVEEERENMK